jgi:type VI secretion system protein ImpF
MRDKSTGTQASILDRLIDFEPGISREPVQNRLANFRQLMALVKRDLENLLNTKNFASLMGPQYKELQNSLFFYGLPDFTAQSTKASSVRDQLRQEVEKAIKRFEPRVTNVVVVAGSGTQAERSMGFKITGLLMADPAPEPVAFDTRFDINRGEYTIVG